MRNTVFAYLRLLLFLAFGSGSAWAQCAPSAPEMPYQFQAVDVQTGLVVTMLCVGRQVQLSPVSSRGAINTSLLYYAINSGVGVLPNPCMFGNHNLLYTPTAPGPITISENYNPGTPGATGTVYFRNYVVKDSPPPPFTVAPCTGNVALVTITDTVYSIYSVKVNSGAETLAVRGANQVPAPAGSTITVFGNYAANDPCRGQNVATVRPISAAVTPVLNSLTLTGPLPGSLTLTFSALSADYSYTLLLNGLPAAPISASTTSLVLPAAQPGNYTLQRADFCGSAIAYSDTIHTLSLTAAATGGHNLLNFDYGGPVASIAIMRNGMVIPTPPGTTTSYDDTNIICGTTYNYQVTATTASGGKSINSAAVTAVSGAVLPKPVVIASFSLFNVVELTSALLLPSTTLPLGSTLFYRRTKGSSLAIDIASARGTGMVFDTATFKELQLAPPCYTVRLVDTCGTASAIGPPTCPSILAAAPADPSGNTVALSWSPFQGPDSSPINYTLLTITADGVIVNRAPVSGNSFIDLAPPTDQQIVRYRLQISGGGLPVGVVSYSNVASVTRQPLLVIPTAFTPNGDGLNDELELKGKFLKSFTFYIVDRNGQEVFRSEDRANSWDGRINGHAPVNGSYVWRFQQTDEIGKMHQQTGTVTILQ